MVRGKQKYRSRYGRKLVSPGTGGSQEKGQRGSEGRVSEVFAQGGVRKEKYMGR